MKQPGFLDHLEQKFRYQQYQDMVKKQTQAANPAQTIRQPTLQQQVAAAAQMKEQSAPKSNETPLAKAARELTEKAK